MFFSMLHPTMSESHDRCYDLDLELLFCNVREKECVVQAGEGDRASSDITLRGQCFEFIKFHLWGGGFWRVLQSTRRQETTSRQDLFGDK